MNTKNNQRFLATEQIIESVFQQLLQEKTIDKITVSEICRLAHINRASFYLHYTDVYDLLEKMEKKISDQMLQIFTAPDQNRKSIGDSFIQLFYFVKEHRDFYQIYLKHAPTLRLMDHFLDERYQKQGLLVAHNLGISSYSEVAYHHTFFSHGLTAMIKMWLANGCKETPEELGEILTREYNPKRQFFVYQKEEETKP